MVLKGRGSAVGQSGFKGPDDQLVVACLWPVPVHRHMISRRGRLGQTVRIEGSGAEALDSVLDQPLASRWGEAPAEP